MPIIKSEQISKCYSIGRQQPGYTALRDVMTDGAQSIFKKARQLISRNPAASGRLPDETFWALKDISFEIENGDRVGIIGRNGAGKSTLLKILSRITEPSTGKLSIKGRVASLLEVGTGFHPELTGRENVYLNGAILGMSRSEIRKKFDEIVAFAEVEQFLDTPVKRYSSGMYVRLAFAVAAHLEPEILVVDEVLAVGDAEFQRKCLGKMEEVSRGEGRTILFVSHNMDMIKKLCNRGIILRKGHLQNDGHIDHIIDEYLRRDSSLHYVSDTAKNKKPFISRIDLDEELLRKGILKIKVQFKSPFKLNMPNVGIVIYNLMGAPLYGSNSKLHPVKNHVDMDAGEAVMEVELPFHSDIYRISVFLGDAQVDYDSVEDAIEFSFVSPHDTVNIYETRNIGSVNIIPRWEYSSL